MTTSCNEKESQIYRYREEANSFCIQAQYNSEQVVIKLKDYIYWKEYQKKYTREDIGKEIHHRVELEDICSVFTGMEGQSDEKCVKQKEQGHQLKRYVFDKVVSNQNGPLYKISSGGIVTIYTNLYHKKNGKQIQQCFESVLQLQKIYDFEQKQIIMIKSQIDKKQIFEKINKQSKLLKIQNSNLKKQIEQFKQIISNLQKKHVDQYNLVKSQTLNQFNKLKIQTINIKQNMSKQIKKLNKRISCCMDLSTAYAYCYQTSGNFIKRLNVNTGSIYQLIMNEVIPKDKIYSFKIKLISKSGDIGVGIMDKKQGKGNQYSQGQAYAVLYCSSKQVYPSSYGTQGKGFSAGESIEVVVELAKGKIDFKVSGNIQATVKDYNTFKEDNKEFVPYIQMAYYNDLIEWEGSEEVEI